MVGHLSLRFAPSMTFRDRAFNTIHEALTISGGSCLILRVLASRSHPIAYKSLMDGLISPYSLLNGEA